MKTQDTKINLHNESFQLLDNNNKIIFHHNDWYEIKKYAFNNNLNIVYYPKDLLFNFERGEEGIYLFLDIKYGGGGHDNLGSFNVRGLPNYVAEYEDVECLFLLEKEVDKAQVIQDMVGLGAIFIGAPEIKINSVKNK